MYNGGKNNFFNNNINKILETKKIEKSIKQGEDKINSSSKKGKNLDYEEVKQSILKFKYLFGFLDDNIVMDVNSTIFSNTNSDKLFNPSFRKNKGLNLTSSSLKILKDANFFDSVSKNKDSKQISIETINLDYKNMQKIRTTSSLTQLEKVYNNLNKVKNNKGLIIGFDTETMGGVSDKVWTPQGITEFAMVIDNLEKNTKEQINILLNTNENEIDHKKNLERIKQILTSEKIKNPIDKLKENNELFVSAQRYSMYGHKDTIVEFNEKAGYYQVKQFAGEEGIKIGDIEQLERGVKIFIENSKVKVNKKTGLKQDISEAIKNIGYMVKQSKTGNAVVVNFNGQSFDIPVINKFIKSTYQNQIDILNKKSSTKQEKEDALKAIKYMKNLFGNTPSFNLNEDYSFDAFSTFRTAIDMFGENKFYQGTKIGKNVLENAGSHIQRQEVIAEAFYNESKNKGTAHTAIYDTNILNLFFTDFMENSDKNMTLIDWAMTGIDKKGILGKAKNIKEFSINPNQIFMATSSNNILPDGKNIFNFIQDKDGKIVTSSNHIISKNGVISFDKITGNSPTVYKNQFYSIKNIQKIDMSKLNKGNELASISPEYGLNNLYNLQLNVVHGSKYDYLGSDSTLNLVFNSKKEMEGWISSNFSYIGEKNKDNVKLNKESLNDIIVKVFGEKEDTYKNVMLSDYISNLSSEKDMLDFLLNFYEEKTLNRRISNSFMFNKDSSMKKISGLLDFYDYLKKNKLDHLTSEDLLKMYFDENYAKSKGIKDIKKIKNELKKDLGFTKVIDKKTKKSVTVLLDSTAKNALFAYDSIKEQHDYYNNLMKFVFEKNNIDIGNKSYSKALKTMNKATKDNLQKTYNYIWEQTNAYLATTANDNVTKDEIRNMIFNATDKIESVKTEKSIFEFELKDSFYDATKSKKISNLKSSDKNLIVFNLDTENPRQNFITKLLKEKFDNVEKFNDLETIKYRKAAFIDFIKNISEQDIKDLGSDNYDKLLKMVDNEDFKLNEGLDLLQNFIEKAKKTNPQAGIKTIEKTPSIKADSKVVQMRNSLTYENIKEIGEGMPTFKNLGRKEEEVRNSVDYILKNFLMPEKEEFLKEVSKNKTNEKASEILYDNLYSQMRGALEEIFQVAGYANMEIQFNNKTGTLNLLKDGKAISINNIPKIISDQGTLYAKAGNQTFTLKHVLYTVDDNINKGEKKIKSGTNLDLNFGVKGSLIKKLKHKIDDKEFSLDIFEREISYLRKNFSDSPTIRSYTMADYLTSNNTIDFRGADPILPEIFNPNGKYRNQLEQLYNEGKLHTKNIINILEKEMPDALETGDLSPVLRMISNADIATILKTFAIDENTQFLIENANSLGKETRISEGNRFIGNNISASGFGPTNNWGRPTPISALNSKWLNADNIDETIKMYDGLLIKGETFTTKQVEQNVNKYIESIDQKYVADFSHRQLYTGVFGVNDILHKEQERVVNNLINNGITEKEATELYKTTAMQVRDSLYEQAKLLDPLLFEGTVGQVSQDTQIIGKALDVVSILNSIDMNNKEEIKELQKHSKINELIDALGEIVVDENGVKYKKGTSTIVKRGEQIVPYLAYGDSKSYMSTKFNKGVLSFSIKDKYNGEISVDKINKFLHDNVNEHSFVKDEGDSIKKLQNLYTFLSVLNKNKDFNMNFEIENINKLELAKISDNYAEKSMAKLIYGKTGQFDKSVEEFFRETGGEDYLYGTVLSDKAIDAYVSDLKKKIGNEKLEKVLSKTGISTVDELKKKITNEQFKFRNIIFGNEGIFKNISGVANDNVIGHRSEGLRISAALSQAISLVGKYENGGKDNNSSYEKGLKKVLDFINQGNGKYDFIKQTSDGKTTKGREQYDKKQLALFFNKPELESGEFNYLDIEKAKNLLIDLDKTFLQNASEEDRLYHPTVKILTGKDEEGKNIYEEVKDYVGNLYFYKNKDGEKIGIGSVGVVNTGFDLDSEFQSNVSKDYLDKKAHLVKLKEERDRLLRKEQKDGLKKSELSKLNRLKKQIENTAIDINTMKPYSRQMKIDDQARSILSQNALNKETERRINEWAKNDFSRNAQLLTQGTEGLIREENGKLIISDLIKSDNTNEKILQEIRGQITYDPLSETKITKSMIKLNEFSKYKDIYDRVRDLGLELGTQHAQLFYEGQQAVKASQFNTSNLISKDALINKYGFEEMNIQDYVSTMGRTDNKALDGILNKALLVDLGEDFNEYRYIALPGLGQVSGTKEIRSKWQQTFNSLSKMYDEYSSYEGLENKSSLKLKERMIDKIKQIREETGEIISKEGTFGDMAKVRVNMPYTRSKLLSTVSGSTIQSPFAEEIEVSKKAIANLDSASFRNKATINGKTIAEWEKGGIEGGGLFFDYRTAGISEFENAGYFNDNFMKNVMGFKEYKNAEGKTITLRDQMIDYLETYGTMDIGDRYPNIKEESLYTGMVFLDRNMADNATAVASHTLLKVNGDSDGDMFSALFLQYKGTNFAAFNRQRIEASKYIDNQIKLSGKEISADEREEMIKQKTIEATKSKKLGKGRITEDIYDLWRGKQAELQVISMKNRSIIEDSILPSFYKESKRNYKGMALSLTDDEGKQLLESEIVGGKSILGKVKLFNLEKHPEERFFSTNTKTLSKYINAANNLVNGPDEKKFNLIDKKEYNYLDKIKESSNVYDYGSEQNEVLDEVLSILDKARNANNTGVSDEFYEQAEKDIFSRIRANTYIENEISKAGKDAIGQINAGLFPIRQAAKDYFNNPKLEKQYNPLAMKAIDLISDQAEQNVISYKKVKAVLGDERLVEFMNIMRNVRHDQGFNTLNSTTGDDLLQWSYKYLSGGVENEMYKSFENSSLLTESIKNQYNKSVADFIKQGMSESEAQSKTKINIIVEQYIKSVNEMLSSDTGKQAVNFYANFGRKSGSVLKMGDIEHMSKDSFGGTVQSILLNQEIGKVESNVPPHRNLVNDADAAKRLNDFVKSQISSETKSSIGKKIVEDGVKALDSANGSGLAMGILGLASGLLISGFAGGNPLNKPTQKDVEGSPKTQAMSVPEFFENQGGYVTGNSQNGYILNLSADTSKGQRHFKKALKQAVKNSVGSSVSINMNFKSNNKGGYSDQDIQNLISNYI